MKFECGDLERALAVSELMPEAREHLKHCAACRREYRMWNEISAGAKDLHEDWDTPDLWASIRKTLEAEPKPRSSPVWWKEWKAWAVAAVLLIGTTVLLIRPWAQKNTTSPGTEPVQQALLTGDKDFLTEQALQEVERTEAAYRQSIEKLSRLAEPKLANPATAVAANYREKLLTLDSAISETRSNLDHNRFNVRLQTDLAELYREKQHTLQELLTREKN